MVEVLEREGARTEVLADHEQFAAFSFLRRGGTSGADRHFHATHVDAFVMLEGELEVLTADGSITLAAGDAVAVPPGVVHGFDNLPPGPVRLLNVHAPSRRFAEYLRRQYAQEPTDPADYDQFPPEAAPGGAPVLARAGEGERFQRASNATTIRFDLPQLSLVEIEFEGSFAVDPHVHDDHVDSFYVADGAVEFVRGEETVVLHAGEFVAVPPGTRHGFRPAGGRPARILNLHAPDAGFADWIRTQ
jgi:quercetin dioxygenase-like cupin family protein